MKPFTQIAIPHDMAFPLLSRVFSMLTPVNPKTIGLMAVVFNHN